MTDFRQHIVASIATVPVAFLSIALVVTAVNLVIIHDHFSP